MILLSSASKPFFRSGKGTVIRASSGQQYKGEIAELFESELSRNFGDISLRSPVDQAGAAAFVRAVVASAFPGRDIQLDDDLFSLGLDSLQTMEKIKLLKAGIRSTGKNAAISWISMRYIYMHPTVAGLSHAVLLACPF